MVVNDEDEEKAFEMVAFSSGAERDFVASGEGVKGVNLVLARGIWGRRFVDDDDEELEDSAPRVAGGCTMILSKTAGIGPLSEDEELDEL
jgi:hypothetical protein